MEIKKVDKNWVVWVKQKELLFIYPFLDLALYKALKALKI
jgi:hypothetical protein